MEFWDADFWDADFWDADFWGFPVAGDASDAEGQGSLVSLLMSGF